jgi:hypothetical protein
MQVPPSDSLSVLVSLLSPLQSTTVVVHLLRLRLDSSIHISLPRPSSEDGPIQRRTAYLVSVRTSYHIIHLSTILRDQDD